MVEDSAPPEGSLDGEDDLDSGEPDQSEPAPELASEGGEDPAEEAVEEERTSRSLKKSKVPLHVFNIFKMNKLIFLFN